MMGWRRHGPGTALRAEVTFARANRPYDLEVLQEIKGFSFLPNEVTSYQ
jgi:hypothetical protein